MTAVLVALLLASIQPPAAGLRSPSELRADLALLHRALERAHPGLHRCVTAEGLSKTFAEIEKRIDHPMTSVEFFRLVGPLSGVIRDGHTGIALGATTRSETAGTWPLLPLEVRVLGGRVFAQRDYGTADAHLLGGELRAIDGVSVETLLPTMLAFAPRDGRVESTPRRWLSRRFRFATLLAVSRGPRATYRVSSVPRGGTAVREETLPGMTLRALQSKLEPLPSRPSGEMEFRGATALLTVRSFEKGEGGRDGFYEESFRKIAERAPSALVIDVRGNGGGYDHLGKLLAAHLVSHPFPYYRGLILNVVSLPPGDGFTGSDPLATLKVVREADGLLHLAGHPNLGEQKPSAPVFTGPVFILMDGDSFSTTTEFLATAKREKRAVFVGEEAGGGDEGNTSGADADLVLPNSRLEFRIPLVRYELAGAEYGCRSGVLPDVPVEETIEDVLAERDAPLAKALELAAGVTTSSSAGAPRY